MLPRRLRWPGLVALLMLILTGGALVYAHGLEITYTVALNPVVEIAASFDSGEPMAEAQVAVYAPDDTATPWLTGQCDDAGRFSFAPDVARPGTWQVQVRQAGHGEWINIPIEADMTTQSGGDPGFTPAQIVLMAGSVIWGFAGTAFYFTRRPRQQTSQETGDAHS